ncbi:MAG TPA: S8 family serine peptidase, partial [Cyclobacteriaceae bacterium]
MGAIKNFLVLFILFVSTTTSAQINRYVIHFTDKNNSEFTINNPSAFLSERSLTRRIKNNVSVTEQDFPVTKLYVNELENEGVNVFYTSRWFNVAIVEMDVSLITIIEDLAFVSEVEYVAPGTKLNGRSVDYESKNTKNRTTAGESDFQINYMGADEMHDDGFKGNGILIAVTDAGFTNLNNISQFTHLYTNGKILYTFDYTVNDINVYLHDDHGTEVFSTMGAFDSGFTGSAPEADYMLFVTEDINSEFRIEEYNWLLAAEFADSAGVDIINASIGYNTFTDASMNYTYEDLDGNTTVISRAAAIAASKGILVVTGSGNEGNTNWRNVLAPGDVETVLTVGSVTGNGNISSFSGVGPTSDGRIKPDLVALGSNVAVINETGNI